MSNSNALSNIWLPSKEVTAMKRNKPSSTDVGISVRGVGNISNDKAIRVLDSKPDNLVSLTLTMLKMKIEISISFQLGMFGRHACQMLLTSTLHAGLKNIVLLSMFTNSQ